MTKIVVGVDGSENSVEALRWAVDHCTPDDELVALSSWTFPISSAEGAMYVPVIDHQTDAEHRARRAVEQVVGETGKDREISVAVRNGHAGRILTDDSADADLLVVGSRGHGGFTGLLLGSISTYCVHHAACPVVVVPHEWSQRQ